MGGIFKKHFSHPPYYPALEGMQPKAELFNGQIFQIRILNFYPGMNPVLLVSQYRTVSYLYLSIKYETLIQYNFNIILIANIIDILVIDHLFVCFSHFLPLKRIGGSKVPFKVAMV